MTIVNMMMDEIDDNELYNKNRIEQKMKNKRRSRT